MYARICRGGARSSAVSLFLAVILFAFSLVVSLPAQALADDDTTEGDVIEIISTIEVGGSYNYDADDGSTVMYVLFSPAESGFYAFSFEGKTTGYMIGYLDVYDSSLSSLYFELGVSGESLDGEDAVNSVSKVVWLDAGDYYLKLSCSTSYGETSYAVSVASYDPPEFTVGESYSTDYEDATYFVFTPASDGYYTFTLEGAATEYLSGTVNVYSSSWGYVGYAQVYARDNSGSGLEDSCSVVLALSANETYYIELYAFGYNDEAFALSVKESVVEELTEGNGYAFEFESDTNYLHFTAGSAASYTFSLSSDDDSASGCAYVLDVDGDLVGEVALDGSVSSVMIKGETYTIEVCADGVDDATFTLSVEEHQLPTIAVDSSYTTNEIDSITYITFTPESDGTYLFTTTGTATDSFYAYLYVYDEDGDCLGGIYISSSDGSQEASGQVSLELVGGDTYILRLTGYGYDSPSFTIAVEEYEVEDADSTEEGLGAELTEMELGVEYDVEILLAGSSAYFSYTPETSGWYCFYTAGDDDAYLTLYDADGDVVDQNDDGGLSLNALIVAYLEAGQEYTLAARLYSSSSSGEFTVSADAVEFLALEGDGVDVPVGEDATAGVAFYSYTPDEDGLFVLSIDVDVSDGSSDTVRVLVAMYESLGEGYTSTLSASGSGGTDIDASGVMTLEAGTTYYFMVLYGGVGVESIAFEIEQAEMIDLNECEGGSYEVEVDSDTDQTVLYLTYTPEETGFYTLSVDGGDSDIDAEADLFVGGSYYGWAYAGYDCTCLLTGGVTYYIGLTAYNSYTEGEVAVSVAPVAYEELLVGVIVTDELESSGYSSETTYYVFVPEESGTYTFTVSGNASGWYGVDAYVYDTSYTYLGCSYANVDEDYSSANASSFDLVAGEAYYVELYSYLYGEAGDYTSLVVTNEETVHTYKVSETVAPTCTEQGYTIYACIDEDCDETYTVYTDALGHSYDAGVVTVEAAADADGVMTYTCAVCGDSYEVVIPATGAVEGGCTTGDEANSSSDADADADAIAYSFEDVDDASKYYYSAIYAVADAGIMTGLGDGSTFGVGKSLNRQQMVVILYRVFGDGSYGSTTDSSEYAANETPLTDVADYAYYTAAVNWAYATGVTTGYGDGVTFGVGDACTFQQFCTFLARAICGGDEALEAAVTDAQADSALAAFSDASSVSSYARKAIAYLCGVEYEEGKYVVEGKSDGTVAPGESVKRERAATVVYRCLAAGLLG